MTFYKPRGVQKPSFTAEGIRPGQLVKYLRSVQQKCEDVGEVDSALRFELIADFFENDYKPGQPLAFRGMHAGF